MLDQKAVIDLAIQAGVIDKADTVGQYISQAYIDDLAHFADLAMQVERAEIIKALQIYHANLVEAGNQHGPHIVQLAINMIEDLRE